MISLRSILLVAAALMLAACTTTRYTMPQPAEFDNTLWNDKTALATQMTHNSLRQKVIPTLCGQKKYLSCLQTDYDTCASEVNKYANDCLERARNRVDMLNSDDAREHTRYFYYCVITEQMFDREPAEIRHATKCAVDLSIEVPFENSKRSRRRR